jgi:hypothetical protein
MKDGWLATPDDHFRHEEGLKNRKLAGEKALAIHRNVIAEAKRICATEGLSCEEYGCPEEYRTWIHDDSPASRIKFEAAKRVADAYKQTLLEALRDAIGDELMRKLGTPEEYMYPVAGPGHSHVLAYCTLQFNRVDKSLFRGLPLPEDSGLDSRNSGIIPQDRNIEVSHTANFGIFNPDSGEQYIPGDLRVIVGVKTVDDVTSYYSPLQYQTNPTAETFLKELIGLESLPTRAIASSSRH